MEVLNVNSFIGGATLGFIGWIAFTVVDLKTETAVIAVKVIRTIRCWLNFGIITYKKGSMMAISRGSLASQISKPPQNASGVRNAKQR